MEVAEMSKNKNWAILNKNPYWVDCLDCLTAFDCLKSHVCRIRITDSPECALCNSGQPMTIEHLVVCPALISLNSTVEKY
ncbi:hypothetical protein TNCV_1900671 [Trichonephila clavipes]|nr:hypothetical protein TNCV_1900671 [Trichonephila clavipes]